MEQGVGANHMEYGPIVLDVDARLLRKGDRSYHLTPKGRQIISGILGAQTATLQQLNALAS